MKPKNFILIILLVIVVGLGIWWFMRPTTAIPEKTAEASTQGKSYAPKLVAPQAIAPPLPRPANESITGTQSNTKEPTNPNAAAREELNREFSNMAKLIRAGGASDKIEFLQTYYTPEVLAKQFNLTMKQLQQEATMPPDPEGPLIDEEFAQSWDDLVSQTPTFNTIGDEATYTQIKRFDGDSAPSELTMVKINGKWYIDFPKSGK